jgi:hypothetical protein
MKPIHKTIIIPRGVDPKRAWRLCERMAGKTNRRKMGRLYRGQLLCDGVEVSRNLLGVWFLTLRFQAGAWSRDLYPTEDFTRILAKLHRP